MEHGALCLCEYCSYERVLKKARERLGTQYEYMADPFPPGGTRTGRFRVQHPPYEQKQRTWTKPPVFKGEYRRYFDKALDVVNWQYRPWPGHEWHTYFTATVEALHNSVRMHGNQWTARQMHLNSVSALKEERFYKIERVDTPA